MHIRVATVLKQQNSLHLTVLVVAFFALVLMYMYFLSMSVVHVVLRKEVHQQIATIESEIASLESSYITVQHHVSNKIAALENFTEADNTVFIKRGDTTFVLGNSEFTE
jgi:hypothetical protein